jgi:hypothetical protein
MTHFILVHSPLVGPATWATLIPALRSRGFTVAAPDLSIRDGAERGPFWKRHAEEAATAIAAQPSGVRPVVVGHSGAGPLLPAIRDLGGRAVAAYIFVDAGLPDGRSPRKGAGAFAKRLAERQAGGHRFPEWTDAVLRDVIPDPELRRALLAELRPQPPAFWDEIVPVFAGWPDAPCGYLRFVPNPSYDEAAAEARARGWAYREMAGGHFEMLVDPGAVADALISLAGELHATVPVR